jgi:hypothetical protein
METEATDEFASDNSQYPLVSGWSEEGDKALKYNQRGWTWSAKENTWLQMEKDNSGNYPNFNTVTYLIHIRSEDDLNLVS